jgi:cellobiose epimerase
MTKLQELAIAEDDNRQWRDRIRRELTGNILPFWTDRALDPDGGFYGLIDCDLNVDRTAERSLVLNTRILWTFSAASRLAGGGHRKVADHAFDYIMRKFRDTEYGGLFWMLDHDGNPVSDRKQIYGQAFGIYALAEYYRAAKNPESLAFARELFALIDRYGHDAAGGGYIEARARDWSALDDMRLSEKDLNCPKSMNTHLHVMEAYTNLLRVWRDPLLEKRQTELLRVIMDRVFNARTGHQIMFFEQDWRPLSDMISFGHDIEASWLLVEAAETLGDEMLIKRAREIAVMLAWSIYRQGIDSDGSLFYEAYGNGALKDANKHWWAQAEAVVGFYNAYQLTGDPCFLNASRRAWNYIEEKIVDRRHGEWHAKLSPAGIPYRADQDGDACLAGPWKCPYHNARTCFEMLGRIKER